MTKNLFQMVDLMVEDAELANAAHLAALGHLELSGGDPDARSLVALLTEINNRLDRRARQIKRLHERKVAKRKGTDAAMAATSA